MLVLALSSQISLGIFRFIIPASRKGARVLYILRNTQNPLSRPQQEGPHPSDSNAGHSRTQVGGILTYEEALRVSYKCVCLLSLTVCESTLTWHYRVARHTKNK